MSLKEIKIPKIITTSNFTFSKDFFAPALSKSIRYDRGVGYFTSGWIKNNMHGLIQFIENGGIARWITSPILLAKDIEALAKGVEAQENPALYEILQDQVQDIVATIESDLLLTLAWLVADKRLIFKIAIPTEKLKGGDFHDKFGIFTDKDGKRLSFSGSYNETAKGEINYESLKIFNSWETVLKDFVDYDAQRFEDIWSSKDPNLRVYSLPTSIQNKIIEHTSKGKRPYKLVPVVHVHKPEKKDAIKLRPFQETALEEWLNNNFKGILRMATGTGKTITAIFCIKEFFNREEFGIPIVLCPFIHLVTQWQDTLNKFYFDSLLCMGDSKKWSKELQTKLQELNINKKLGIERETFVVICTYDAFYSKKFQNIIHPLKTPNMIIADEVHNLGTKARLAGLPDHSSYRLALSATPERFMDEEGTQGIYDYFEKVVYSLELYEAIFKLNVLSHYDYSIHTVQLTDLEFAEYREITKKIAILLSSDKDALFSEEFDKLLRQRANILNNASAKLKKLREILMSLKNIDKTLIYCSPQQLKDVNQIIVNEFDIISHQVTYRETGDKRDKILSNFEKGIYQAITAIRCLDEGLDVPSINSAVILASSSNPREFIQRRGRVLRKSEDKEKALIIDIMTIPSSLTPSSFSNQNEYTAEKSIVEKELKRISHFASCADNKNEALLSVYELASMYNLQHILMGD